MNEIKIDKSNGWVSEPFGSRRPARLFEWMISFLHSKNYLFLQRMLAPIARKMIVNTSALPIDISAGDIKLRCQFTDNYSEKKFVFSPWRYDYLELLELKKVLSGGGVFIDIGANVGLYTLVAAHAMGANGTIIAIEPNPLTLQRLKVNLDANSQQNDSWPNIHVLNVGIADENGERMLQIDDTNLGECSIAKSNHENPEEVIQCRLLMDVLEDYQVTRIDVLKIDIEGAEDVALVPFIESADDSLLPGLIIIENSDYMWSRDLFGLLAEKGYRRIEKTRLNSVLKLNAAKTKG